MTEEQQIITEVTTAQTMALYAYGYTGPEPENYEEARSLIQRLRYEWERTR